MSWKDVTAECEAVENRIHHEQAQGEDVLVSDIMLPGWANHYRLTKISGPLTPHVAFIVEKRA